MNFLRLLWIFQNNQCRGRGYQLKPKAGVDNLCRDPGYSGYKKPNLINFFIIPRENRLIFSWLYIKRIWNSCFCFFSDRKQYKTSKLHMIITHRNHAWVSLTWSLYNPRLGGVTSAKERKYIKGPRKRKEKGEKKIGTGSRKGASSVMAAKKSISRLRPFVMIIYVFQG